MSVVHIRFVPRCAATEPEIDRGHASGIEAKVIAARRLSPVVDESITASRLMDESPKAADRFVEPRARLRETKALQYAADPLLRLPFRIGELRLAMHGMTQLDDCIPLGIRQKATTVRTHSA